MKKIISVALLLIMVLSMALQPAFASEEVTADYVFGGVAAAGTSADTIEKYDDTDSGNWKWYGSTWTSSNAVAKIRNWSKDSDDRIHVYGTLKDEWFAFDIKAQPTGIYAAEIDYFGYNPTSGTAGACDIYVIERPAGEEVNTDAVNAALAASSPIGALNFKDTTLSSGATANKKKELRSVAFEGDKNYLLVFKTTADGEMLIKNLHVEKLGELSEFSATATKTTILTGDKSEISVAATDSNGRELKANNFEVISYSSSDSDVATVVDGVITAVASGTAKITVTATLGDVTKTAELNVIVVSTEKYLFSGVKDTWEKMQGSSSYKTVEGIPYDQTMTGNWAWHSKNTTSDNFKVFALSTDSRLQIAGMVEKDWFALKIKSPGTGKWSASLEYVAYGGDAGKSDIYIIPFCDENRVESSLVEKYRAGNVNYSDSSLTSGTTKTKIQELKNFTLYENREYIVVFKVTATGNLRPNQLVLTEIPGAQIEKEPEWAQETVSFAQTTNIDGFNDISIDTVDRGDSVTLTAHEQHIPGYKFVGWKRGADTSDDNAWVDITGDTYRVWTNTYLTAVYEPIAEETAKVVEFWNQNGTYLGKATEATYATDVTRVPTLTGFGTFLGWFTDGNLLLTPDTELKAGTTNAVAQYKDGDVSGVTHNGGAVSDADVYNAPVELNATSDATTCWKRDGEIIAYGDTYKFNVWDSTNITEGTEEITDKVPVAILDYSANHKAYMLEYDAGAYEIVEAGIIFGKDTVNVKTYTSQRKVAHNQFTVPAEGGLDATGYIIYTLDDGVTYEVKYVDITE